MLPDAHDLVQQTARSEDIHARVGVPRQSASLVLLPPLLNLTLRAVGIPDGESAYSVSMVRSTTDRASDARRCRRLQRPARDGAYRYPCRWRPFHRVLLPRPRIFRHAILHLHLHATVRVALSACYHRFSLNIQL